MTQKILSLVLIIFIFSIFHLNTEAANFTVNDATSLISAINTANSNGEDDVIILMADITLTAIDNSTGGDNGLPNILADGGNSLTFRGNSFTIARDGAAPNFRIIRISAGANLTLDNLTISNGSAGTSGGGIINFGTLALNNSTVSGNTAGSNGGGIFAGSGSNVMLNNSTISDNTSTSFSGGGIFNFGSNVMLNNSTISGNIAGTEGGGFINHNGGSITLSNSTISGNAAGTEGGGIYNNSGTTTFINSIVAGNTATSSGDECFLNAGTFTTDANNLFGIDGTGGGCLVGISDLSPNTALVTILSPLADNDGPTQTHALVTGSPAINASSGGTTSDQRGAAAVGTRDIGAYEFDGIVPTVIVGTVSTTSIAENGGTATISVTVANLASGDSLQIVANIVGGTATDDTDYTITDSLTFNADGSQNFTIAGLTDVLTEGDETLTVNFTLIGAANISGNDDQMVTILDVVPPAFSKVFAPDPIVAGSISTLTFMIDNTASSLDGTSLDFTDNLPAGMIIATPSNASTTCTGGTLTAVDGTGVVTYTGGTTSAGATCTVQVDITSTIGSSYVNTTGDLTSSLGNSGTASADLTVNQNSSSPSNTPAQNTVSSLSGEPNISVFDPAISKIGFLVLGQVGVTGEQLEWIVTVNNTGDVIGNNVTITDNLVDALQIDSVDATNASVTINGQTVSVTYATLQVGETVQFSIFTTVLEGASVSNTACVTADTQGAEECATAIPVSQLPSTGETPVWRDPRLIIGAILLGLMGLFMVKPRTKIS